jgi:F-type H+-transporting ATPase subunit gamma
VAANAGRNLVESYLSGDFDEVYVVYSEFLSMGRQIPTLKQLLPIPPIEIAEAESRKVSM